MNRKERRQMPRGNSNVPLDLYDPKGQVIIGEGRFVNISLAGSLLESRQSFQVRQPLRLQVQAPGKSPTEFAGRIVWRKKKTACFYYGIRFEPFSTSHLFARQSLDAYSNVQP